jgi:hypothetical protein
MINLKTIASDRIQTPSGIARAALKSATPFPIGDTLRLSRRPCTASSALVGGEALLRVESFFAVALPHSVEKGGGKKWRWVLKPKPCAPCRKAEAGAERSNAIYQGDCARCGRKVRSDENYFKARLWASIAVFHWACFIALMKEQGETAAEDATWKASRVSRK